MTDKNTPKSIDDIRGILGIFREAIFNQVRFDLILNTQQFQGELVDVIENSRRDKDEQRTLLFRLYLGSPQFTSIDDILRIQDIELRFGMEGFLVKASTQLVKYEEAKSRIFFHVSVPASLLVTNVRKNRRKESEAKICSATLLVRSGSSHTEGIFDLYDYSRGGFGGVLKVPHGFSLVGDTSLNGQLQIGASSSTIHCAVRRITLLDDTDGDWDSYRIGVEQLSSNVLSENVEKEERRKNKRQKIEEHITLTASLNKDITFSFILQEASVTGFSGVLATAIQAMEFPIGSAFQIQDMHLHVVLRGFDGDRLRFSIQGGQITDRLNWFKKISPYLLEGVSHSVFEAKELLQVFCASGALSSEYLKTQRTHKHAFLDSFEKTVNDSFWVHRWIHHNKNRSITGHACALRVGDSSWLLADLAGSPTKETKLPKEFLDFFLKSFSDFSCSLSPCPQHLYTWVIDHPFWKDFRDTIFKSNLLLEHTHMGYSRYSDYVIATDSTNFISMALIYAHEYQRIEAIKKKLLNKNIYLHASILDFDLSRYSSPLLSAEFQKKGQSFFRYYYEMSAPKTNWLVVYSHFPSGASFNKIPEAIWVFQIDGDDSDAQSDWSILVPSIYKKALFLGQKPSSIRRIFAPTNRNILNGEIAILENILVHPLASSISTRVP